MSHAMMLMLLVFLFGLFFSRREDGETRALYQKYYAVLRRRCFRILRDDAMVDDAMQEIFWTVSRQIDQYRGDHEQILPWLYRVTTTHCFKLLERDKRWVRNLEITMEQGSFCGDFGGGDPVDRLAVGALLSHLPPSMREMVMYRYFDEMTQEEIAEVMGVSRDHVRTGLKRFFERVERWREAGSYE
ncbi:MAG: sigma-70 family RNA polymerase sigma factor [Myxococcales bacterium]|nr:sigma-70 family RNA polymerase sigma factor [Myxococcales bacterium]MCB9643489.1 sigma-70 family RNA polymerase sigma factor [Myxococcales bacterium]